MLLWTLTRLKPVLELHQDEQVEGKLQGDRTKAVYLTTATLRLAPYRDLNMVSFIASLWNGPAPHYVGHQLTRGGVKQST